MTNLIMFLDLVTDAALC